MGTCERKGPVVDGVLLVWVGRRRGMEVMVVVSAAVALAVGVAAAVELELAAVEVLWYLMVVAAPAS